MFSHASQQLDISTVPNRDYTHGYDTVADSPAHPRSATNSVIGGPTNINTLQRQQSSVAITHSLTSIFVRCDTYFDCVVCLRCNRMCSDGGGFSSTHWNFILYEVRMITEST